VEFRGGDDSPLAGRLSLGTITSADVCSAVGEIVSLANYGDAQEERVAQGVASGPEKPPAKDAARDDENKTLPNLLTERRFQPKPCSLCGRNSVVECHLAKVNVEGSSPFARSKALVKPGLFLVHSAP
jgi:hypothetical protein